jgi:transposase
MVGMHIHIVPNRNSKPAVLLRESFREGKTVHKRTLANLSKLPMDQVESIRRILKGDQLVSVEDAFEIVEGGSYHHGHVEAVMIAIRRLGFDKLIASKPSPERDRVVGLVAARILQSQSKLATSRWWLDTTLPQILGLPETDEDDLYAAMDWVLKRQPRIEKKLAARHLESDALALYDLTSSYIEGATCPLARFGYDRDGKKGKRQVNYGLLTNRQGVPVAVSVFEGNMSDPKTLMPQVEKLQNDFDIDRFTLVGDRGMITQTQIDSLRNREGLDWISALRSQAIRKLANAQAIQMGLFDERNLFELTHPDFPQERLVACRNSVLAKRRTQKRQELLRATGEELEGVRRLVERGRLLGKQALSARLYKVLNGYQIRRYYQLKIRDDGFEFKVDTESMAADAEARAGGNAELAHQQLSRWKQHREMIDRKLERIRQRIGKGRLHGKDKIGLRVGKVLNRYKVGKHFKLDITDHGFDYAIDGTKVAEEAAIDGIYVIRTSLPKERMEAEDTVRSYKLLTQIECAFRSFKTLDLKVRPIHHRLAKRVRAHIFVCMLAYYVEYHMIEAWRPLLFCDEDQEARAGRDPVAPARRSEQALRKVHAKKLEDGSPVHSFRTLLSHLGTIVRNQCRRKGAKAHEAIFEITTTPNPKQRQAYDLLKNINV